ncbi:hypothetical protein F5883DRAFT_357465, partial [Diaporthe sp. PMI_573]
CCFRGDLTLPPFTPLPRFLKEMLLDPDHRGRDIRRKIREYNNAFAFTSVNCTTTTHGLSNTRGALDFQIQGILYHTTGPLQQIRGVPPQFAQFYFYDPNYAADLRFHSREGLDWRFLTDLTAYLHQHNPYI